MAATKEEREAYMRAYYLKNKKPKVQHLCVSCGTLILDRPEQSKRCTSCAKEHAVKQQSSRAKSFRALNPGYNAERQRSFRALNPGYNKKYQERQKRTAALSDSYVAEKIGFRIADCPQELLEIKREALVIKRLSRQIKQTTKAQNETSTNIS